MVTPGPAALARHLYRIESRAEAEAAIRQGGAILLMLGVVLLASLPWLERAASLTDRTTGALLYLFLGGLIYTRRSRVAAVIALLLAWATAPFVFEAIPGLRYFVYEDARIVSLFVFLALAFGGAVRSIQGTFLLYRRYIVTRIVWRKLVRLWVVVLFYTAAAFVVLVVVGPTDISDSNVVVMVYSVLGIVFFLGCVRWLPFTKKLAILKNETDDLDALPF